MRLASFKVEGHPTWGIIEDQEAVDVGAVLARSHPDLKSWIAHQDILALSEATHSAPRHSLAEIAWLPVIPNPEKIFCVGLNYELHRKETGRAVVAHPTIFARFANTQTGHLTDIVRPRVSTNLDFEGELAIIVGKPDATSHGKKRLSISQGLPATTTAVCGIGSTTPTSSRRARTSREPEASDPGWLLQMNFRTSVPAGL